MKRSGMFFFLLVTVLLAERARTSATIVPALNVHQLADSASVIAAGEVVRVTDDGVESVRMGDSKLAAKREIVQLRVERLLKGRTGSPRLNIAWLAGRYPPYGDVHRGQFAIFFLRRDGNTLSIADRFYPFLIALKNAPPARGSIYHEIVHEVAYVLRSARSLPGEREKAVEVLNTVRDDGTATRALRVAASTDSQRSVRLLALAALFGREDISLLDRATDELMHASADERSYPLAKLAVSLQLLKDPRAIPVLTELLVSKNDLVRQWSAAGLAHIGTRDAVDPLVKALYDSNQEVRFYAVSGLARITGQDKWGPGPDYYKPREDYYLAHWREWAKER